MATRKKRVGYQALRSHAARVLKLGDFPMHVNGAYMDDPSRIPILERQGREKA